MLTRFRRFGGFVRLYVQKKVGHDSAIALRIVGLP